MNRIRQKYWIALTVFLFVNMSVAQISYECTISQAVVGSNLEVSMFIRSTGTSFKLGGANFTINVNTSGLDITNPPTEITEGLWDNGNDPINYSDQFPSRSIATSSASINIDWNATSDGVTVPGTPTLIGTISIPISNSSLLSGVDWRVTGLNQTSVFDTDVIDITGNGTFTNPGDFPLPVELTSFSAEAEQGFVTLQWTTESEINNLGFEVYRSLEEEGDYTLLSSYKTNEDLQGQGNSSSSHDYYFSDETAEPETTYWYKLADLDYNGARIFHDPISIEVPIRLPEKYKLYANYPNPFNPSTTIKFDIPPSNQAEFANVSIDIYNVLGQLVRKLYSANLNPGTYKINWDSANEFGDKVSGGMYFYLLKASVRNGPNYSDMKKMILLK